MRVESCTPPIYGQFCTLELNVHANRVTYVVTCCSSGLIMRKMDIFSHLVTGSACLTDVSDKQSNL